MPGNNSENDNTTYHEMNVSMEALDDLHCLLDTHSENLQEKLLLLAVVTHSLMAAQNLEYFESHLPCGHKIRFINDETHQNILSPPAYLH